MTLRSLLTLATSACLLAALAAPSSADDGGGKGGRHRKGGHAPGRLFARFDKDHSGSLTSDEVPERLWTRIAQADADGDGAVTKAELKAACKERGGRRGKKGGADV